jgi:hypothetical protein
MNSFSATLHVKDLVVPVLSCSQHVHQATDAQGEPTSRAYAGELQLHLALPPGVFLPYWAYQPDLALDGFVAFAPLEGLSSGLRLAFEEGHCVSYEEHYEPGVPGQPALHCRISIVARRFIKHGTTYESIWPAS